VNTGGSLKGKNFVNFVSFSSVVGKPALLFWGPAAAVAWKGSCEEALLVSTRAKSISRDSCAALVAEGSTGVTGVEDGA